MIKDLPVVEVGWLLACIASLAIVAACRLARFGDGVTWVWLVAAPVSSLVDWSSSLVDDEIGFRARVDWRVGGVETAGDLALPRGDYVNEKNLQSINQKKKIITLLLCSGVAETVASGAVADAGTSSFDVAVSTGGGAVSATVAGAADKSSLATLVVVDNAGSGSVVDVTLPVDSFDDAGRGSCWLDFSVKTESLVDGTVSTVDFSFFPLTCALVESFVPVFPLTDCVVPLPKLSLVLSFCPLTTGCGGVTNFSAPPRSLIGCCCCWIFVWDTVLPKTGVEDVGSKSSTDWIDI